MTQKTVDASTPFFKRNEGEIGVYIKIYDAKAEKPQSVGSERFYRMDLMDKLFEIYSSSDIVKMKAGLERKHLFQGAYLERFEKGIILVVGFDDVDALERVWKLHQDSKLQRALQDVLMTPSVLNSLGASNITLWCKMLDEEYTNCKNELLCRKMVKLSIKSLPTDLAILKRMKTFQEKLSADAQEALEVTEITERKLGEFLVAMKQIIPKDTPAINTLKEFETYHKVAKGANKKTDPLDAFTKTLNFFRTTFCKIEEELCHPMLQIHKVCENEKQQEITYKLRKLCSEAQELLKPEVNLQEVKHPDWKKKVLKREQELYCGLICIIPLSCNAIKECSYMLDEFILDFPSEVYK